MAELAGRDLCFRLNPSTFDCALEVSEKQGLSFQGMPIIVDSSVPADSLRIVSRSGNHETIKISTALDELAEATSDRRTESR